MSKQSKIYKTQVNKMRSIVVLLSIAVLISCGFYVLAAGESEQIVWQRDEKKVAITFDDGPDAKTTALLLDGLKARKVRATFFVIGEKAEQNPELICRMSEECHLIGNHTYSHNYSYLYPNKVMNVNNIVSDLQKNENAMKEVLGKDFTTRVIRLPGGYWSWDGRTAMKEAMEQDGYYNVDWNALDKDAEGP